ncbi:hypothetical protein LCGC14_0399700 [marine sediment metagenome]|uniref:Uncharacterized protein n=1 Tax=marine sediment metagenome TaxID=412755 RepID=A0A0F9W664_9ZZZZ
MVMSGFAPSKLFETLLDDEKLQIELKRMREAAVIGEGTGATLWGLIHPNETLQKRIELAKKAAAEEEHDIGDLMDSSSEIREAVLSWYDQEIDEQLEDPPAGAFDDICDRLAAGAAQAANAQIGRDVATLLEYPQYFLAWLEELLSVLTAELTKLHRPGSVYISVANVDIPQEDCNDAQVAMLWYRGYAAAGSITRQKICEIEIPWFGRQVVKQDCRAYVRALMVRVHEALPKEDIEED